MKPLVIHAAAEEELRAAARFYEQQVPGLGTDFLEEIRRGFRRLQATPGSWPVAYGRFRRLLVRRFPFAIFYQEFPDRIWVLAAAHQKRRPGYWRGRTR